MSSHHPPAATLPPDGGVSAHLSSEGHHSAQPLLHVSERRAGARGFDVGSLVRAGLWLAILGTSLWFLAQIHLTLVIFGLAWLIAYLMNPVVAALEGRRLGPLQSCPRGLAVGTVYLLLFGLAALGGSLLIPLLTSQINRLIQIQQTFYDPHQLAATIQDHGTKLVKLVPEQYRAPLLERLRTSIGTLTSEAGKFVGLWLSRLAEFFGQMLAGAAIFLSAMLISIYMLLNWRQIRTSVVSAFPIRYQEDVQGLIDQMNRIFGGYLRATILTSLACTVSSFIALGLYGLITGAMCPYTVIISIIAGLTYPIPLFGILTSTVIAAILAFMPDSDFATAAQVGGIVLIVNVTIDRTLLPKLMSAAIGVSPLFVIFAAAAGGEFMGGVSGMLLGIPLAAMFKAVFVWFHGHFLTDPHADTHLVLSTTPRRHATDPNLHHPAPTPSPSNENPNPPAPPIPTSEPPTGTPVNPPSEPTASALANRSLDSAAPVNRSNESAAPSPPTTSPGAIPPPGAFG